MRAKLGLPQEPVGSRRRWRMAELRFALESVSHMSVREIAEEMGRSEKAVREMIVQRGIEGRFQDEYSLRELAEKLHVRRTRVRNWVKSGLLRRKRSGRIDEESLQSFLYSHPENIRWPVLDEDTASWISQLVEAERTRVKSPARRTDARHQSSAEAKELTMASFPIRPKPIHPRITHRLIAKRMAPALGCSNTKESVIGPFQEAKPKKLRFLWVMLGKRCCIFQKPWASPVKDRGHRLRNVSIAFDDQTEPVGECPPFNEFGNGLCEPIRRNQLRLALGEPLRISTQVDFRLPELGKLLHKGLSKLLRTTNKIGVGRDESPARRVVEERHC